MARRFMAYIGVMFGLIPFSLIQKGKIDIIDGMKPGVPWTTDPEQNLRARLKNGIAKILLIEKSTKELQLLTYHISKNQFK